MEVTATNGKIPFQEDSVQWFGVGNAELLSAMLCGPEQRGAPPRPLVRYCRHGINARIRKSRMNKPPQTNTPAKTGINTG